MSDDLIKRSDALSAAGDMSYIAFEIRKKLRMIPSAEPMPDYIDNILVVRHYCNGMVAMNEECYKRMQSVNPTVSDRPQGEWKNHKDEHYCTNCGEVVIGDWYDEDDWYTYCPNCGAKMSNASNASNTLETLEKGETE